MNDIEPDTPTESELVARARSGDETAFQALCVRNEARLRARLARWIQGPLRRKVSVVDVMQEAYLTAHELIGDFEDRGEGAFGAWLSRIAERKARDAVRRYVAAGKRDVRREVSKGARPDTSRFGGREPSPSEWAVSRERAEAVERAVDDLSPDARQLLHLVRVEGMTLKDAAVVMGRSHAAVRKLYGRTLARLATRLRRDGKERDDE